MRPLTYPQHLPGSLEWMCDDIRQTAGGPPTFPVDGLRQVMEPHISKSRKKRDQAFGGAASVPLPHRALRVERCATYNPETFPLADRLASLLQVSQLSELHLHHISDKRRLLAPLLQRELRRPFQRTFDDFVAKVCVPFLHQHVKKDALLVKATTTTATSIMTSGYSVRYQAFPCIRVVRPGEFSIGPHCDVAYGHSTASLNVHVPLTACYGTNALYTESSPGSEDWHALTALGPGNFCVFHGAQCLHFTLENTTHDTRVSLDFRVALSGNGDSGIFSGLESLTDRYSDPPGYYDWMDATMDDDDGGDIRVQKRYANRFLSPDRRVGFPFVSLPDCESIYS